jgi:2',3'-cyclic-nucleotide 2'-phosphodiesterase
MGPLRSDTLSSMSLKVLYIAEIVGKAGVYAVKRVLPSLKRELKLDFVIAGGDGVTGGSGLGKNHAVYLRKLGVDSLLLGDCTYYKKDIVEYLGRTSAVLRPANYPPDAPGRGFKCYDTPSGRLGVAVFLGQAGYPRTHLENPFNAYAGVLDRLKRDAKAIIFDFHATTTAEKRTLFSMTDGKLSAVIGSHTRVATSDAAISAKGTATVTDAGRTGSTLSVGGLDPGARIGEYLSQIPDWSKDAWAGAEFNAFLLEIDDEGRTRSMERICRPVEVPREEAGTSDLDGDREAQDQA